MNNKNKNRIKKNKDIFSKYKGMSFAEAADAIGKKYKNKDTDLIQKKSFETELKSLMEHQEMVKAITKMEEVVKEFKNGGTLPKYTNGIDGIPKKTFSTLEDQPDLLNTLKRNTLAYDPDSFIQDQNPVHPDLSNKTFLVSDPQYTQAQDLTRLTPDAEIDLPVQNRSFGSIVENNSKGNAFTPALVGQGISTAINAGILLGGANKEAPVNNPYESEIKRIMQERGVDTTAQRNQILSAENVGRRNLNNVRSANIRNALDANIMNVTQQNLEQSKLNEQQINNAYKADYAAVLNNLGQQKAGAQMTANELNARNKGQQLSNLSALGASVANNAQWITSKKLNENMQKMSLDILNNKYADYGLSGEYFNSFMKGKKTDGEILELKTKMRSAGMSESDIKSFDDYLKENKNG